MSGCSSPATPQIGSQDKTLLSGGVQREYTVHIPKSYRPPRAVPVYLVLDPGGDRSRIPSTAFGFDDLGERAGFITVVPWGLPDGDSSFWFALPELGTRDVAFIRSLLDTLDRELCIDKSSVYATGMENGAQMASFLACEMPERITGVAAVAGVQHPEPCRSTQPTPIVAFHGTADRVINFYTGGGLDAATVARLHGAPTTSVPVGVEASMQAWAAHNGCEPEPDEQEIIKAERRDESPAVWVLTWKRCRAAVVLYVLEGGEHVWPGQPPLPVGRKSARPFDATTVIHEFFIKAGPLPAPKPG